MPRPPQSPAGRSNRNGDRPARNDVPDAASIAESIARRGPASEDTWGGETPTSAKLGTLSAEEHEELLATLRKENGANGGRAAQLRAEAEELRATIAELHQQLDDATAPHQGSWEDREREFETILEEKSEEIRLLYMQIQEREHKKAENAAPKPRAGGSDSGDEELGALADELSQDQARLDEERESLRSEREQLRHDEEEMERRMQEMELQTSKSRADLVRQRNELHRQYNEVRSELEQAKQTGNVSDRVKNLEREAQELSKAGRGR